MEKMSIIYWPKIKNYNQSISDQDKICKKIQNF